MPNTFNAKPAEVPDGSLIETKIAEAKARFKELCLEELGNLPPSNVEFRAACEKAVQDIIWSMDHNIANFFKIRPPGASLSLDELAASIRRLPKLETAFNTAFKISSSDPAFVFVNRPKSAFYGTVIPHQEVNITCNVSYYEPFTIKLGAPELTIEALLWKSGKPFDEPKKRRMISASSIEIVNPQELADAFLVFLVVGKDSPGVRK